MTLFERYAFVFAFGLVFCRIDTETGAKQKSTSEATLRVVANSVRMVRRPEYLRLAFRTNC